MKKSLRCKACRRRLIDVCSGINAVTFNVAEEPDRKAFFFLKCCNCKCENGIVITQ